jgi:hypothetical protein
LSQHLGECEILRESIAQGKHRTVTEQRHVERLVLGSEIQGLPTRSSTNGSISRSPVNITMTFAV